MGIRMLHRRRPARAQASAESGPAVPPAPVPPHAATASTARIPTDLTTALRRKAHRTAAALRRTLPATPDEPPLLRLWTDLGRTYAARCALRVRHAADLLLHARRTRQTRTISMFIVTARPDGPAPR